MVLIIPMCPFYVEERRKILSEYLLILFHCE